MNGTYDIFSGMPHNGPIWIETVHGLENARARLNSLIETKPGDYFVFDSYAARIVHSTSDAALAAKPHSSTRRASRRPTFFQYLQSSH
jgi:hypothetical protein